MPPSNTSMRMTTGNYTPHHPGVLSLWGSRECKSWQSLWAYQQGLRSILRRRSAFQVMWLFTEYHRLEQPKRIPPRRNLMFVLQLGRAVIWQDWGQRLRVYVVSGMNSPVEHKNKEFGLKHNPSEKKKIKQTAKWLLALAVLGPEVGALLPPCLPQKGTQLSQVGTNSAFSPRWTHTHAHAPYSSEAGMWPKLAR